MAEKEKKYLYKDLNNLMLSKIFTDNVAFKLTSGEYTTHESHQIIAPDIISSNEGEEDSGFLTVKFDSCYDNIESTYNLVLNPEDNAIINYKFESPYMYSYAKPYTKSNKDIINRETKSIGYKDNGDIINSSRELYHLIFSKNTNSKLINIYKEIFKGNEKDKEDPKLNSIINIRFNYTKEELSDEFAPLFLKGYEEYTLLDRNGNIEDHTKANTLYADTSCGETICVDKYFDYMSSKSDNEIIIPTMVRLNEDNIRIEYIRKADEKNVLSYEDFYIETDGTLTPTFIKNNMGEIKIERKDDTYQYIATMENEGNTYIVEGECNYPLSCNIFSFSYYRHILGFASLPYFDQLYCTDINGEVFLVKNKLNSVTINDGTNNHHVTYKYDEYGMIISQEYISNSNIVFEGCKYSTRELDNGNKLIESMILAEPVFPINKKSIFYRCIEITNEDGKEYISSDYRTVAITHKNYNI